MSQDKVKDVEGKKQSVSTKKTSEQNTQPVCTVDNPTQCPTERHAALDSAATLQLA